MEKSRSVTTVRNRPIVLKKSDGKLYGRFLMASTDQLTCVRAMAAVLDSRVTNLSFPAYTRREFFNTIGRKRTIQDTLIFIHNH
jgi:hypothetical protein